jgi:hypothetical protein
VGVPAGHERWGGLIVHQLLQLLPYTPCHHAPLDLYEEPGKMPISKGEWVCIFTVNKVLSNGKFSFSHNNFLGKNLNFLLKSYGFLLHSKLGKNLKGISKPKISEKLYFNSINKSPLVNQGDA